MHERLGHDTSNCSIARTLDVVGEKWTMLILREAFYGVSRFGDFEQILHCPRNLLAARLRKLVDAEVLATEVYREPGARGRHQYVLTDKGADLVPAVLAFLKWGDQYLADPDGPAVLINHTKCGEPVVVEMRCASGHAIDGLEEIAVARGPSFRFK